MAQAINVAKQPYREVDSSRGLEWQWIDQTTVRVTRTGIGQFTIQERADALLVKESSDAQLCVRVFEQGDNRSCALTLAAI